MNPGVCDESARFALDHFALDGPVQRLDFLGNHGGFSGARLWRCETGRSAHCLRVWPAGTTSSRLALLHSLMTFASSDGLGFVPTVCSTRRGSTGLEHRGRLWEVTRWLPGRAAFHAQPTPAKLLNACTALARLHLLWQRRDASAGPCPAVARRLRAIEEWRHLMRSGWRPRFGTSVLDPLARRAWELVPGAVECLPVLLEPWRTRRLPLQSCLCDVWHDHLLYEEDTLTGLIDYGAVKTDHVAVDLARMLGSLVGDDAEQWEAGLRAYRQEQPLSGEEEALAVVLDRSGVVLGASNWLRWLYHDGRHFEDLGLVARRLAALVNRLEHCARV